MLCALEFSEACVLSDAEQSNSMLIDAATYVDDRIKIEKSGGRL